MTKIVVEYLDHMGSDLTPANAARVSLAKQKSAFDDADKKLLKYLKTHGHESPFFHAIVQFRCQVPIFIERQIMKHQIGLTYNSVSMRYVEPPNEYFHINEFRKGSASIKQGSLPELVEQNEEAVNMYKLQCNVAFLIYEALLKLGVCKEQARAVLPMSTMTEFIVTGSLAAYARMYNLRSKTDAQAEIREFARQISTHMVQLFPESWKVLTQQEE